MSIGFHNGAAAMLYVPPDLDVTWLVEPSPGASLTLGTAVLSATFEGNLHEEANAWDKPFDGWEVLPVSGADYAMLAVNGGWVSSTSTPSPDVV